MKTKVSIVKCNTYNPEEVQAAVIKSFDLLGGFSSFIKSGERVLVKPNMLSGRPPEDGVNTHVEVTRAVVRLVKQEGAFPVIGDTPGGSVSAGAVYESSGFLSMAREEGIECAEVKDIKILRGLPIASYFLECDKIISLPKMKTHSLMSITGGIKNMFGAISGLSKSECHKKFPRPERFVDVLMDVFEIVKPHLVLMDGIIAMDGDGPSAGRLRQAGLLIASRDSVAIDSVFSSLIGVNPYAILSTKKAYEKGLGEIALENMEILGQGIEESFIEDFRLPGSKIIMSLPEGIINTLAGFVKFGPRINEKICRKCNICADTCPVSAITINQKESRIDYAKCIRCMCCHEVCPYKAVELRRNILARAFGL